LRSAEDHPTAVPASIIEPLRLPTHYWRDSSAESDTLFKLSLFTHRLTGFLEREVDCRHVPPNRVQHTAARFHSQAKVLVSVVAPFARFVDTTELPSYQGGVGFGAGRTIMILGFGGLDESRKGLFVSTRGIEDHADMPAAPVPIHFRLIGYIKL
jgi:hypothetical protein